MQGIRLVVGLAVMMVLFIHAARLALVVFDPYLASRPLAEALMKAPPGRLILDDQYYTFSLSSSTRIARALLLNGRVNNLEYGSYAPDAPQGRVHRRPGFQRPWRSRRILHLRGEALRSRGSRRW